MLSKPVPALMKTHRQVRKRETRRQVNRQTQAPGHVMFRARNYQARRSLCRHDVVGGSVGTSQYYGARQLHQLDELRGLLPCSPGFPQDASGISFPRAKSCCILRQLDFNCLIASELTGSLQRSRFFDSTIGIGQRVR
jgi:hypothetical protein